MTSYSAISLFDSGTTSQCSTCNTTPVGHSRIDLQPWPAISVLPLGLQGCQYYSSRPAGRLCTGSCGDQSTSSACPKIERAAYDSRATLPQPLTSVTLYTWRSATFVLCSDKNIDLLLSQSRESCTEKKRDVNSL